MTVTTEAFGALSNGTSISAHTLKNSNGIEVRCMDFGAILLGVQVPDRNGQATEVTLGYDTLAGYEAVNPYFGASVGRVANRIGGAQFVLDGTMVKLPANEGANMLHGGVGGFHARVWQSQTFQDGHQAGVTFTLRSEDGDQGFPGNLDVAITISLTESNQLMFEYRAESDAPTPVNLTNHSYWNLSGAPDISSSPGAKLDADRPGGRVADHRLMIPGDRIVAVDDQSIPTGVLDPVDGTAFDFRSAKTIGEDIDQVPGGYDHSYVLGSADGKDRLAATVEDQQTGRRMEITTTCPSVQFYTGNYLEGVPARNGVHRKHNAFCLETQFHPDAVNHNNFPSTILRPGEVFEHRTVHTFSTI